MAHPLTLCSQYFAKKWFIPTNQSINQSAFDNYIKGWTISVYICHLSLPLYTNSLSCLSVFLSIGSSPPGWRCYYYYYYYYYHYHYTVLGELRLLRRLFVSVSRKKKNVYIGRDDRSHRVSRGARGRLRADGHAGHQKSTQVSKQSPTGESSPFDRPL